ncbi:MAG: hypothetical protein PF440_01625 [Thiomicrorhabdus sp.]|jgi:magnesium-transporting ATPase (P-type)|nr:hypothetical protein [Thiomicrorhabdus sp.]
MGETLLFLSFVIPPFFIMLYASTDKRIAQVHQIASGVILFVPTTTVLVLTNIAAMDDKSIFMRILLSVITGVLFAGFSGGMWNWHDLEIAGKKDLGYVIASSFIIHWIAFTSLLFCIAVFYLP